jgi:tryptophanyl-tRNA synthetase
LAKGFSPTQGLFAYPILMAADILLVNADLVPVGKDQKQHIEVTRDIAIKFNNAYGETFKIPEPSIRESVAVVPGIDGQKMSKSYDNTIEIFATGKPLKKRVMSIVTDSTPLEDPKNPDACNVYALLKLFRNDEQLAELADRYRAGGMGYGHVKKELLEEMEEHFAPFRAKRDELANNMDYVEEVLQKGAAKVRATAQPLLESARKAVGLR